FTRVVLIENKEENIYFTDSIYFNPSEDK
ncbi:tandem-type lipoprotein, partial [Staphylococcus aureus]